MQAQNLGYELPKVLNKILRTENSGNPPRDM
jgi:hypothetical protein